MDEESPVNPPADQPIESSLTRPARRTSARILIAGGDPATRVALVERLGERRYRCTHVGRLDEARAALGRGRHDLVLLHPALADGDGLELIRQIRQKPGGPKTIIFGDQGSFRAALESGATDFIRTPIDIDEFAARIDATLTSTATEREREQKLDKLQRLCAELNDARSEISDQVDVLCSDMLSVYEDLTDQISEAAMAAEFRTLLRMELDLEQVLRTTLEYLLSKTGPTNAAVFLPDPDKVYSLGAYVNYDCPRESIDRLLEHLCGAICPQMSDEHDLVVFDDAQEFAQWIGLEDGLLERSQVIAFSCHHNGECMAVVVMFRSGALPFDPPLARTLDILRSIFARQLNQVVRIHHRSAPQWPDDAADDETDYDDDHGYGFGGGLAA